MADLSVFPKPGNASRNFPRWLRVVAGSFALAVAAENMLGARAWNAYLDEAAAAGEASEAFIPPPVSDAENFAAIPLFQPLFDYERATPTQGKTIGEPVWRDPVAVERLKKLGAVRNIESETDRGWRTGDFIDLAQWQKRLRDAGLAGRNPSAKPGADLLNALAEYEPEMLALRAAAARPHCRFPVRYEEKPNINHPHLAVLRKYTFIARTRAIASLSLGDTEAAARDAALGLRLAHSIHHEPQLVPFTIHAALFIYAMPPLWEGLARRQWNEAQLATLDSALARFNFLESYTRAIRGERSLYAIPIIDLMERNRGEIIRTFDSPGRQGTTLTVHTISHLLPSGCFDFNKATAARYYDRLLKIVRPTERRILVDDAHRLDQDFKDDVLGHPANPRTILVALLFPNIIKPLRTTAYHQTMVDLARIAVALERYRIRHGKLPAKLASLVPDFLKNIPSDVITGKEPVYRPRDDGNYDLYSTGWNGRDEGGKIPPPGNLPNHPVKNRAWDEGDWPWPMPAKAKGK